MIIARTGVLPTDPRFIELSQNQELLHFTAYWLQKRETDLFATLGKMLGVVWNRDQIAAMQSDNQPSTAPKDLFLPLSAAVNPDLVKGLTKLFRISKGGSFIGGGEYIAQKGEEVVNLGDLPQEEFMQWAGRATGAMREVAKNLESRQQTVTIQEGASDDPRIERMKQQIQESKRW